MDHCNQHHVILIDALALLHNLFDHQKRNAKSEMDGSFNHCSDNHGYVSMLCFCNDYKGIDINIYMCLPILLLR